MPLFGKSTTIAGSKDTRRRFHVLLMPAYTGKVNLISEMSKYTSTPSTTFFDADTIASSLKAADLTLAALDTVETVALLENKLFPLIEGVMLEYLKNDKTEGNVCLATCNLKLVTYLGTKDKRILIFLPSADMTTTIYKNLQTSASDSAAAIFLGSKNAIINVYGSVDKETEDYSVSTFVNITDVIKKCSEVFKMTLSAI